jgi:hypothetical protein
MAASANTLRQPSDACSKRIAELLISLQPSQDSESRRQTVASYICHIIRQCFQKYQVCQRRLHSFSPFLYGLPVPPAAS